MGNGYTKQVQKSSTFYSDARDIATSHRIRYGHHPEERYRLSHENDKGNLSKCSREGKYIMSEYTPKDTKLIANRKSESHGQGPFFNCSKEDDGVRITAAFSLDYSANYSCPNSTRKVPHAQSAEELEVPSVSSKDTSQFLPGGFTTRKKGCGSYIFSTTSRHDSYAEPVVTLQDRNTTANKNILKGPNCESKKDACSNKNESYVQSASKNTTSYSISNSNSSVIWSVKNTKDTRKPATDLLWSYQPQGRMLGDTTIPTLPVLSYGDQFPFHKSMISPEGTDVPTVEKNHVKNLRIPLYHTSRLDSGNVHCEVANTQTRKELISRDEPLNTPTAEWVRPSNLDERVKRPFDCVSFEQSQMLGRSSASETSTHNSPYTRGSLLSNDLDDDILRDMRCRGMPSSLRIGYPIDRFTLRQHRRANLQPTSVKDWSQTQNDDLGFSGTLDPKEQPTTAKGFIHGPPTNNPDDQLSKTLHFSKASSAHYFPSRVAGMEPTRISKPTQVPNLDNGSFYYRSTSCNQHCESKVPQYKNATSMIRESETQQEGDRIEQRRTLRKFGECHESVVARTSQTYVNHVKKPFATVLSEARSEARRSRKTEMKPTNQAADEIAGDPRMSLPSPGNTINHEGDNDLFSFSPGTEYRFDKMEIKKRRKQVPSKDSAASAINTADVIQQPKRKARFNWDSFTASLQRENVAESISNAEEDQSHMSNNRLFIPKNTATKIVAPNHFKAKSSHTLTCGTEGNSSITCQSTDSTSNADSSYGADTNIEGLVSYGKSDNECSLIPVQETTEGLEVNSKPTCDICGKTFTRKNTLLSHQHIHSGAKPYSCKRCGRNFRQQGNLTRHMLIHTNVKSHTCAYCNKMFMRASNLHSHLRMHTNYRPFDCDICGKGFYQKMDLKIHRYTHTGEKPHRCSKCGKRFKQLTHLKYHLRIHSDVRMFKCELCGKGFNQKGNLQAHIYGHTGNRPHKCDTCGKAFTLASTLNTHKRTHALTKPFQCTFCNKAYYQKNALKTHIMASHPFTSGHCNL